MIRTPLILTALILTALGAAGAQTGTTGQRQMTPEMQARLKAMQPVTDLAQTVRLLPDLEKNKATALTKAQAKQLLPILTTLQKASSVQPNDAKKYLTQIEDRILTGKQLAALDTLLLKAEQEREARRTQNQSGQNQSQRVPGMPGALGGLMGGQRPAGASQAGPGQNSQGGQPGQFNPFRQGRSAEQLGAYIKVLQKK
ncbi:hypothetical protein [Deinococcus soli (ex Cha et al. 2016)]|uniref:Uncharacterized protein n=2 Tax=Deinococcus soli (ex Cha et al. 2016) TaxID=1309411 RepID=A0ACC6KKG3_9DEIO|nr:hypothetical protein [Deinococcus soli (ex Cha et al. 2016)]MDR6220296.1 hypothetical protein [Deinococcus soli (ex Cha et al. 2016)]MDR6330151.1 hypothetical protein [Deinococcus soli (ex Cha et al. 2016)]MDR6752896.1 hypothetical protein [Deinococcus soli (ex Cha et al. 2016)]